MQTLASNEKVKDESESESVFATVDFWDKDVVFRECYVKSKILRRISASAKLSDTKNHIPMPRKIYYFQSRLLQIVRFLELN